jgi:hypothetical protein
LFAAFGSGMLPCSVLAFVLSAFTRHLFP